jgi:hypothetical protein
VTASTIPSRPTVEDTTAAHAAFSWAYRGDLTQARTHLKQMTPEALHAARLAGALIAAQADQILGGAA